MDTITRGQSPIFNKTFDFLIWLLDHTEKFPKSERFRLAQRLENSAFNFYELLVKATRSKQKRNVLFQADAELEKLRLYTRMAYARKLINPDQYRFVIGLQVEIGKLLGGWVKKLSDR